MTGEGEGAEPPAAGTAPFAETGADDRPLGVELGDRHMPASVVEFAIDLVGQQDDPIASCDSRQSSELLGAVRLACRVVRIVQDDEARPLGVRLAEAFQIGRLKLPFAGRRRVYPSNLSSDDASLRRIRDPGGCRDDQITVVHQLQEEHELLGAGSNQHVLRLSLDAVAAMVVVGHGLSKRREPTDRQVVPSGGVLTKGLHHGLGHGKRRLAQAKLEDRSAVSDERGAALVDGPPRTRGQSAYFHVRRRAGLWTLTCPSYPNIGPPQIRNRRRLGFG